MLLVMPWSLSLWLTAEEFCLRYSKMEDVQSDEAPLCTPMLYVWVSIYYSLLRFELVQKYRAQEWQSWNENPQGR